mmetsp:Transcript_61965/g.183067  ORF Transcript_61965/g.183067 Transcript_61965/m.183067 type:complete len:427 (-) Transcript_61965:35-1315(-)
MERREEGGDARAEESDERADEELERTGGREGGGLDGPNGVDGETAQGAKDRDAHLSAEDGLDHVLEIFDAETAVHLQSKERPAQRTTEKGRQCPRHAHESVLPHDVAVLLLEDLAGHVPPERRANGDQGSLGTERPSPQDGELGRRNHGEDVGHGYVRLVVDALDGVGQIPRLAHHLNAQPDEDGHEEPDEGDPKHLQILGPDPHHVLLGQNVPQIIQQKEQNLIINERGDAAHDSHRECDDDGLGDGPLPKFTRILPEGRLGLSEGDASGIFDRFGAEEGMLTLVAGEGQRGEIAVAGEMVGGGGSTAAGGAFPYLAPVVVVAVAVVVVDARPGPDSVVAVVVVEGVGGRGEGVAGGCGSVFSSVFGHQGVFHGWCSFLPGSVDGGWWGRCSSGVESGVDERARRCRCGVDALAFGATAACVCGL